MVPHATAPAEQDRVVRPADSVDGLFQLAESRILPPLQLPSHPPQVLQPAAPHVTPTVYDAPLQLPPTHLSARIPSRPSLAPSIAPRYSQFLPPVPPCTSSAPVTSVMQDHLAGGTVSPTFHSPKFAHRVVLLDSFPEDNIYIRKPLSALLTPPRHLMVFSSLAHLAHELVVPLGIVVVRFRAPCLRHKLGSPGPGFSMLPTRLCAA